MGEKQCAIADEELRITKKCSLALTHRTLVRVGLLSLLFPKHQLKEKRKREDQRRQPRAAARPTFGWGCLPLFPFFHLPFLPFTKGRRERKGGREECDSCFFLSYLHLGFFNL